MNDRKNAEFNQEDLIEVSQRCFKIIDGKNANPVSSKQALHLQSSIGALCYLQFKIIS